MCTPSFSGGKTTVKQPKLCVFNLTRQSFLSFGVTPADTHLARLKGLLGRMKLHSEEGIWLAPSQGMHTIGMLFPIDVIYLTEDNRVIHLIEHLGPFRITPIRRRCASILELPTRSIYASNTQIDDELVICSPEDLEKYSVQNKTEADHTPVHL
ncbi:MAG TPA: DUF192 domain-containing protein [Solibacterales bacterium]|nr:DUF192 domain-containing protein [Bryobacterales bacterium]